nr:ash family protein [Candidatus Symbiopectobacterium sp. NZEC135]
MVAQAGQPSGWPVSDSAGTANPVWATTNLEISSSGGGIFTTIGDYRNGCDPYPNSA